MAYQVGLWVLVFWGGLALLFVFRQYGSSLTEARKARERLVHAARDYERGAVSDAQRTVLSVLEKKPELAGQALDGLGMDLLGMPKVFMALGAHFAEVQEDGAISGLDDRMQRIQYLLVSGRAREASSEIDALAAKGDALPEAFLWKARIALAGGDPVAAREAFDAFWEANASLREELAAALDPGDVAQRGKATGPPDDLGATLDAMLWAGLWEEAFRLNEERRNPGAGGPESDFVLGLHLESRGQREAAASAYSAALGKRPNHVLSLLRLRALVGDGI